MRRFLCHVLALTALLTGGTAGRASAGLVLDQVNDPGDPAGGLALYAGNDLVQTFTAGQTGNLDEIDVRIFNHSGATASVILELWTFTGTTLTTQIGGDFTVPSSSVPTTTGFVSFDLSGSAPHIVAGDHLAILLKTTTSSAQFYGWQFTQNASYPGGEAFSTADGSTLDSIFQDGTLVDFGFKTFVDPNAAPIPEPSSLVLASMGIMTGAWPFRRLRRREPD